MAESVLALRSRVLIAAGALGDLSAARPEWLQGVDAAITRSVGVRAAGASARIEECAAGVLVARPYAVQSLDRALRVAQPIWARMPVPVIVSVWAESAADYAALAHELAPLPNVAALELNLLGEDGAAESPAGVARATEAAAAAGTSLIAKLAPSGDVVACGRAAARAGASTIALGHGWPAVFEDGASASLCGPASAPQTRAVLHELLAGIAVPIVVSAGAVKAADVQRLLDMGAAAVALGAALLRDPSLAARIALERLRAVS